MSRRRYCIDRFLPPASGPRAVAEKGKFWRPGQTLRIRFLSGTADQMEYVKTTAAEWLKYANLRFEFITHGDSQIRITFDDFGGSWSYIGTDSLGIPAHLPTMNFGWLDEAVVLHEFGHALGLGHEHQNPTGGIQWNIPEVIRDLSGYPNYWDEATIRSNIIDKYSPSEVVSTTVDAGSIMMYSILEAWTLNDFATGFNQELSPVDKAFIASLYPRSTAPVHPELEWARAIFLTAGDVKRLNEPTLVRLGRMLGANTDERKTIAANRKIVIQALFNQQIS